MTEPEEEGIHHGHPSARLGMHTSAPQSVPVRPTQWTTSDFFFGPVLGEGLFGKVYYARCKDLLRQPNRDRDRDPSAAAQSQTSHSYRPMQQHHMAIKVTDKQDVIKRGKVQTIMKECTLLVHFTRASSPWVVRLHASFDDPHHLFLAQECCVGGSLRDFVHLQRNHVKHKYPKETTHDDDDDNSDSDSWVQSLGVQLLLAMEHIHAEGIVHGDLSANNVMLTPQGRIKIIDFGCAIDLNTIPRTKDDTGKSTAPVDIEFAGTADYIAPEVIMGSMNRTDRNKNVVGDEEDYYVLAAIDLWAFACLIYFMLTGESPFHSDTDQLALCKIMDHVKGTKSFIWPPCCSSHDCEAQSLVQKILIEDPSSRLGTDDKVITNESSQYISIRRHPFFACADWEDFSVHVPDKDENRLRNLNQLEMTDGALVDLHFFA